MSMSTCNICKHQTRMHTALCQWRYYNMKTCNCVGKAVSISQVKKDHLEYGLNDFRGNKALPYRRVS